MSFITRRRWIFLLVTVMVIAAPGASYAQLGSLMNAAKGKAVEALTNSVMKGLEKNFTKILAKESLSAAAKADTVQKLSEMSRPLVKQFIDNATSGKLPKPAELLMTVLNDILPRVPELVAAIKTEDGGGVIADPAQAIAVAAPETSSVQPAGPADTTRDKAIEKLTNGVMKDLEKNFTKIVAKEPLSAAAKADTVQKLSEMSRPLVKQHIDSAASGKLPKSTELSKAVLNDIMPRVPEIVAAAKMEGSDQTTAPSAQVIAVAPSAPAIAIAVADSAQAIAAAAPETSSAQPAGPADTTRDKAVEKLTNGVIKDLEKRYTKIVAKEPLSAAAKADTVQKLSEMSRPLVKQHIDSAASGKLPKSTELSKAVLNDIMPRVPEIVAAAKMEGSGGTTAPSAQAVAAAAPVAETAGPVPTKTESGGKTTVPPVAGKTEPVQTKTENSSKAAAVSWWIPNETQNMILLKNKNVIVAAEIVDVLSDKINYLNYGGRLTSVPTNNVLSIRYKNGTVKVINEES